MWALTPPSTARAMMDTDWANTLPAMARVSTSASVTATQRRYIAPTTSFFGPRPIRWSSPLRLDVPVTASQDRCGDTTSLQGHQAPVHKFIAPHPAGSQGDPQPAVGVQRQRFLA